VTTEQLQPLDSNVALKSTPSTAWQIIKESYIRSSFIACRSVLPSAAARLHMYMELCVLKRFMQCINLWHDQKSSGIFTGTYEFSFQVPAAFIPTPPK